MTMTSQYAGASVAAIALIAGMILSTSAPAHAECTGALFQPQVKYFSGPQPHGATLADFDGDDILDLAVANSSGSVSFHRGQGAGGVGNGTFAAPVHANAGIQPWGLTSGDFDEDGDLDLAVVNVGGGDVSILIGNGNGTFALPVNYACGAAPYNVVTGDFNEDDITDLAVANNGTANVRVLIGRGVLGVGDGTFFAAVAYPIADLSTGIATGDFNADGILDLVATTNYSHAVAVLLGQGSGGVGDGTFAPASHVFANFEPFAVATADLDEDGALDLVAGDAGFNGIAIMLGNGVGGFSTPVIYNDGVQNAGLVIGDWDHDGIPDLASADGRNHVMYTLRGQGAGGDGNGTFGPPTSYPAGLVAFPMTGGDLNEDGSTDLITVNNGDNGVSVFLAGCDTTPPPPTPTHAPVLTDVRDVPHDQGGRVFVTWLASDLDVHGSNTITSYRVWRRIHPEGTAAARAVAPAAQASNGATLLSTVEANGATTVYWEALVDLPAQKLEGYGYTAPTTQDSMKKSNPYTAFFITALTGNPGVFYSSNIDSGYSKDNIKPRKPQNPIAALDPGGFSIAWEAPDETFTPDVGHYRVYRGNTADFTPDAAHQIGQTEELEFVDEGSLGAHYYKLTTVDLHENESDAETLGPLASVAVGDAVAEFALHGSTPHPARPSNLTIGFSLPTGTRAMLELFDLGGRRIAAREVGRLGAGVHRVNLAEGLRLRAGVYVVRLSQGNRARSLKAIVTP